MAIGITCRGSEPSIIPVPTVMRFEKFGGLAYTKCFAEQDLSPRYSSTLTTTLLSTSSRSCTYPQRKGEGKSGFYIRRSTEALCCRHRCTAHHRSIEPTDPTAHCACREQLVHRDFYGRIERGTTLRAKFCSLDPMENYWDHSLRSRAGPLQNGINSRDYSKSGGYHASTGRKARLNRTAAIEKL